MTEETNQEHTQQEAVFKLLEKIRDVAEENEASIGVYLTALCTELAFFAHNQYTETGNKEVKSQYYQEGCIITVSVDVEEVNNESIQ